MINIAKIANLAKLTVSKSSDFEDKLEKTIKYVDILKELDTKNVLPTFQVGNNVNKLREDEIENERIIPTKKYQSKVIWK